MAPNRSFLPADFKYMPCFFCGLTTHFSTDCRFRPANRVEEHSEEREEEDKDHYDDEEYYEEDEEYHEEDSEHFEYDENLDPQNSYIPCVFCGKWNHYSAECRLCPPSKIDEYKEDEEYDGEEEYIEDYDDVDYDEHDEYEEDYDYIPCFFCGKKEHFSTECRLRPANADNYYKVDKDEYMEEYEEQEAEDTKETTAFLIITLKHDANFEADVLALPPKQEDDYEEEAATDLANKGEKQLEQHTFKPIELIFVEERVFLPTSELNLQLVELPLQPNQTQTVQYMQPDMQQDQQDNMLFFEQGEQKIMAVLQQGQPTGHEQNLTQLQQPTSIQLQHLKNEIQHDLMSDFQRLQGSVTAKLQQKQQQLHHLLTLDFKKQAMDKLLEASTMAEEHIPKQGWAKSIATWGMGYFTTTPTRCCDVSEKELSCRIIEAEATYLSALLCFFEESVSSFLKGALLIRKAISGYKRCHGILQVQMHTGSKHEVGAIKLGFGGFSLAISMLPPKLLRLLSVLGFPSDQKQGLSAIEESLCGGGLRASVSGLLLLSYHVILPAFFSIPQEREHHVECAERVLVTLQEMYPGSFFLSFYRGRLQRLKRDLQGSVQYFLKLEEGLRLSPDSKFFKMRHAWLYELGVSHMLELEWGAAEKYWAELEEDSVWSRAFFAYMHGVCLSMNGKTKSAANQFAKVQGLMRGKISGRVLAEEQYVSRKVKDHSLDTEEGVQSIQGRISGLEFLYLWNSFPQMPHDKLEGVIQIIEGVETILARSSSSHENDIPESSQPTFVDSDVEDEEEMEDDLAVCCLIKGTAFRELGKLDAAQECLDHLREESCYVGTELFVYPMAAYERALLLINRHSEQVTQDSEQTINYDLLKQAKKELATAESFKHDYNFLWRLLGRVHAARGAIQGFMTDEESSNNDRSTTKDDQLKDQWSDNEDNQHVTEEFDISNFSILST